MPSVKQLLLSLLLLSIGATVIPVVASDSPGTVLITGANRGIGLALAQQFARGGYQVIGTARKPDQAEALAASGARVEQLDVASPASVAALAERLQDVAVDILVNNAGIIGHDAGNFADLDVDKLDAVLSINTLGPLRVTQALLPNLQAGQRKTVANISSMMGSMALNTWGCCLGYRASKAALNSATKTLALDLGKQGMVFIALHPGYVKTDMNEGRGNISSAQSASGLFTVISGLDASHNGKFFDFAGKELPW